MENTNKEIPPVIHKNNPRIVSIISYLTIFGWLVAYILNNPKSELSSFHLRQSLGIYLIFLVSSMCMWVPLVGWVVGLLGYLLGVGLWIIGITGANREEVKEVPFLGFDFQKWFAGL